MKSIWFIQAETNIHVGNENTSSVGLIDKEIQRDVLTGIPCINSSSLKGAMNEYATSGVKLSPEERVAIFGVDKNDKKEVIIETQKGGCLFFDAYLLLLPVQDDKNLYKLVACKKILEQYKDLLNVMGINLTYPDLIDELKKCDTHFNGEEEGSEQSIISFEAFQEYCSNDELPIIARNSQMGTGNLWYEQVLPQKSIFGTILIAPSSIVVSRKEKSKNEQDPKKVKYEYIPISVPNIDKTITKTFDKQIVQIGANATIGYGYCKFIKIKEE